jgi:hypothetical protein
VLAHDEHRPPPAHQVESPSQRAELLVASHHPTLAVEELRGEVEICVDLVDFLV